MVMQLFNFALQALQDPLQAATQMADMGITPADLQTSIAATEAQVGQMMQPQPGAQEPTQLASVFSGAPNAGVMSDVRSQPFPVPEQALAAAQSQPQAQPVALSSPLGEDGLPDVATMEAYIREQAQLRGHDPEIAVKVARAEGLQPGVWQSNVETENGVREPSFGPFQLLVGGEETGFPTGLGNEFMAETGLNPADPSTWQAQVDFVMDNLPVTGWSPFYGADAAGVADFEGVGTAARLDPSSQQLATSADTSRTGSTIDFARAEETSLPTPPMGTVPSSSNTGNRLMAARGDVSTASEGDPKKKSLQERLKALAAIKVPEAREKTPPPRLTGGGPSVGGGFGRNPQSIAQLFALLGGGGPPAGQAVTPSLSALIRGG